MLLYALIDRIGIKATCDKLPGAPSCNRICTFVKQEVLNRYQKGKAKKHGVEYLTFAVLGKRKSSELQIADEYRHMFGIESSDRMTNQVQVPSPGK